MPCLFNVEGVVGRVVCSANGLVQWGKETFCLCGERVSILSDGSSFQYVCDYGSMQGSTFFLETT
jgi:hypothetical protein